MPSALQLARQLAQAFLAGPWETKRLVACGADLFGERPRWWRGMVRRVRARFKSEPPSLVRLSSFIRWDSGFRRGCEHGDVPVVPGLATAADWPLPALGTLGQLAEWLGVTHAELDWFADRRWLESKTAAEPLRHYRYRWHKKPDGRVRLIESPKPRLKAMQRRILHEILDLIPPHDAAHGFRAGRSIRTFTAPHVGRAVVLKMDLRESSRRSRSRGSWGCF